MYKHILLFSPEYSAFAVDYINKFQGICIIQVRKDCIVIQTANGSETIGCWAFAIIREFKFDDERNEFHFMSGRRGPFGVAKYNFKLHQRTFFMLKEIINRIACSKSSHGLQKSRSGQVDIGDLISLANRSNRLHKSVSDHIEPPLPPVPPHRRSSAQIQYQEISKVVSSIRTRSTSLFDLTGGRDFLPQDTMTRSNSGHDRSKKSTEFPEGSNLRHSAKVVSNSYARDPTETPPTNSGNFESLHKRVGPPKPPRSRSTHSSPQNSVSNLVSECKVADRSSSPDSCPSTPIVPTHRRQSLSPTGSPLILRGNRELTTLYDISDQLESVQLLSEDGDSRSDIDKDEESITLEKPIPPTPRHRNQPLTFIMDSTSTSTPESPPKEATTNPTSNYQVPRPAESAYSVPRQHTDPRNDYQVPLPVEKTYMVPRREQEILTGVPMRPSQHTYEDPDKI